MGKKYFKKYYHTRILFKIGILVYVIFDIKKVLKILSFYLLNSEETLQLLSQWINAYYL